MISHQPGRRFLMTLFLSSRGGGSRVVQNGDRGEFKGGLPPILGGLIQRWGVRPIQLQLGNLESSSSLLSQLVDNTRERIIARRPWEGSRPWAAHGPQHGCISVGDDCSMVDAPRISSQTCLGRSEQAEIFPRDDMVCGTPIGMGAGGAMHFKSCTRCRF